jgi:hypothetical protein
MRGTVQSSLLACRDPASTLFIQNRDIHETGFLKPAVELVSRVEVGDGGLDAIKDTSDLRPEGSSAGISKRDPIDDGFSPRKERNQSTRHPDSDFEQAGYRKTERILCPSRQAGGNPSQPGHMGEAVPPAHLSKSVDPDRDLAALSDRREDTPEAITRAREVVQHPNAVSEVEDTRLEGKVINVSLDHMASRRSSRIVSRNFDAFAQVQTYHLGAELLCAVQEPALATADIRPDFPGEKIVASPFKG